MNQKPIYQPIVSVLVIFGILIMLAMILPGSCANMRKQDRMNELAEQKAKVEEEEFDAKCRAAHARYVHFRKSDIDVMCIAPDGRVIGTR